jgi:hypothetical protein
MIVVFLLDPQGIPDMQPTIIKNIIIFWGRKDPKPIFAISQLRAAAVDKSNVGGAMLPKKIRVRVMFLSLLEIVIHEFPVTWFETVNADG